MSDAITYTSATAFFQGLPGPRLHFRNGPDACSPSVLFERACPELSVSQREVLLQSVELSLGGVGKGGRRKRRLPKQIEPGEEVVLSWPEWSETFTPALDVSLLEPLCEGPGWHAFAQSPAVQGAFLQRECQLEGNSGALFSYLYSEGAGVVVLPEDPASLERWNQALASGGLEVCCVARLPVLPWGQGQLCAPQEEGRSCRYRVLESDDESSLVEFVLQGVSIFELRQMLADGGYPILGDALLGGRLIAGGLQL
ncbi:MAG: hypothetical protein JRC77_09660, partial [Deltaproteobacteria bacterium]|nr:hypothetical protein [Deltaproteobacteria bacterium]